MTREVQRAKAAHEYIQSDSVAAGNEALAFGDFINGAKWADSHTQWYEAQSDNVPEYGREVIVIGRDGKVFFGHRPNPKEVTMVEGKPYHAKTYDKNGWNWPDIALWLDVELPNELIEQITGKWLENLKATAKERFNRIYEQSKKEQ